MENEEPICPGCGWPIDPECCWCGAEIKNHGYQDGHSPVPMGCTCGYHDAEKRKNPNMKNKVGEKRQEEIRYKSIFSAEQLAASVCSRLAFEGFIPLIRAETAKLFAIDALKVNEVKHD